MGGAGSYRGRNWGSYRGSCPDIPFYRSAVRWNGRCVDYLYKEDRCEKIYSPVWLGHVVSLWCSVSGLGCGDSRLRCNDFCAEFGPADVKLALILSGDVINAVGASPEAKKLFLTAAKSASVGFGVAIMPGTTPDWTKILTNGATTGVSAVACGTAADKLKGGSLAAAVTFAFSYK